MNERIKYLLNEATSGHEQEQDRSKVMTVSDAEMERFAFLIIRECMTICKKHPSRDLENLWTADAVAPDLVHQFSEHFGVEE